MQEIQRRLKSGELDEQDIREVVWEYLKPSVEDLIDTADEPLYTEDEYETAVADGEKYLPIIQELTRAAYDLIEFDAPRFREQLKDVRIFHGHA